ncbi:MAG: DnaA ATPase domain-containing protein, partial [Chthoniobacterales bacterium]
MDEKCAQIWSKLSAALKPQVSPDTYKRWFSAVKLIHATPDTFTFLVPNNIYQFWIESNHMAALQAAIVSAFGEPRKIKFTMPADGAGANEEIPMAVAEVAEAPAEMPGRGETSGTPLGLNPRNNFESFVVGPNNEIAHAASLAVAQSPARTYNPLF